MTEANTLVYVTGNRFKFEVAQQALHDTGMLLEQQRLDAPELQSNSVQEIAEFSSQWVRQQWMNQGNDRAFFVTDAGFYIDALNGFPGPFVKYANQWFGVEELLRLMATKRFRRVTVHDCVVYARPGAPPVTFLGSFNGTIATTPGPSSGTPFERLYVPHDYDVPISEFSPAAQRAYWQQGASLQKFKQYLLDHATPDQPAA